MCKLKIKFSLFSLTLRDVNRISWWHARLPEVRWSGLERWLVRWHLKFPSPVRVILSTSCEWTQTLLEELGHVVFQDSKDQSDSLKRFLKATWLGTEPKLQISVLALHAPDPNFTPCSEPHHQWFPGVESGIRSEGCQVRLEIQNPTDKIWDIWLKGNLKGWGRELRGWASSCSAYGRS